MTGLEALESIKFGCCNFEDRTLYGDEFKIIEKELKEKEETNSKLDNLFEELGIESKEDLINRLKALEIIIKYTYSGGWSGDYTTQYWDMRIDEIKVIEKVFKNVPMHALSDKKANY